MRLLFASPLVREPGIYLWTVPYWRGGYLVTYVGEIGESFGQWIEERLIQTISGNYRICDPDSLSQVEVKVLWKGRWRKATRDKLPV